MKPTGMLVVSLRGVNSDFGLAKGVLGKKFKPSRSCLGLHMKK